MKKLFGKINMTWTKVIIMAIITGVYTGVVMSIPKLDGTSFQDIGVYMEWWFLFAIIIIVNCDKWWEASLKCFAFFLISQPLVYLVQVPFSHMGWGLFMYYKYWAVMTVLTIPGAAIAYLIKKNNWLSVIILSVANCYMAWGCMNYIYSVSKHFPNHLLSAMVCFALAIIFIENIIKDKKKKGACYIVFTIALAISAVYFFVYL